MGRNQNGAHWVTEVAWQKSLRRQAVDPPRNLAEAVMWDRNQPSHGAGMTSPSHSSMYDITQHRASRLAVHQPPPPATPSVSAGDLLAVTLPHRPVGGFADTGLPRNMDLQDCLAAMEATVGGLARASYHRGGINQAMPPVPRPQSVPVHQSAVQISQNQPHGMEVWNGLEWSHADLTGPQQAPQPERIETPGYSFGPRAVSNRHATGGGGGGELAPAAECWPYQPMTAQPRGMLNQYGGICPW